MIDIFPLVLPFPSLHRDPNMPVEACALFQNVEPLSAVVRIINAVGSLKDDHSSAHLSAAHPVN